MFAVNVRALAKKEQGKDLRQVQAAARAALPLGPYDPAHPGLPEASVADRDAIWNL